MCDIKVGDRVKFPTVKGIGRVAFIGETHFSDGLLLGLILDDAEGRCDGSVDGIRYFKCSKNRGIFVRWGIWEKVFVNTSDDKKKQFKSNMTNYLNYLKANFDVKECYSDASGSQEICEMELKRESCNTVDKRIAYTSENKCMPQNLSKDTSKIDTAYLVHSSSSNNEVKYPNCLKAISKISWNHICEAKHTDPSKTKHRYKKIDGEICCNNSDKTNCTKSLELGKFKTEIEELKDKLKVIAKTQQETRDKFKETEKEIMNLRKEFGCLRNQISYQEHQPKLLEMGHLNLYRINNCFINATHNLFSYSANNFGSENITEMISRQKAELRKQNEKTLQGYFEIKEFLSNCCTSPVKKRDFFNPPSRSILTVTNTFSNNQDIGI